MARDAGHLVHRDQMRVDVEHGQGQLRLGDRTRIVVLERDLDVRAGDGAVALARGASPDAHRTAVEQRLDPGAR